MTGEPASKFLAAPPIALTIATSDSGGGAGIQADLKTFAALKVYGLSALSAVTAQNSFEVTAMECLSPQTLTAQLKALHDDFRIGSVKIGLLGAEANIRAVADFLMTTMTAPPVVLDPVMVSTSGHVFLSPEEIEALKFLMPRSDLVTPNLYEAEILTGLTIGTDDQIREAADRLRGLGARAVLIKGGHRRDNRTDDLLVDDGGEQWFRGARISTPNTHGTGCSLSSAIAAGLASGLNLVEAVTRAKSFLTAGLKHSYQLGRGAGPIHHFHEFY